MKKLKILYDYSPACRKDKVGIPTFVSELYNELNKIDTISLEKTTCISDYISRKPWIFYRFIEKILYQNIYLPLKMYFGKYDIYIECNYMFIPLFKPKNTLIVNFIYDIGLILFDDIQVKKQIDNWRKKLPISIKNSDLLITLSKSSQKDIQNYLSDIGQSHKKVDFIYANSNSPAPNTIKYKDIQKKFSLYSDYFLFLGTIEPRKSPLRLIESFRLFKQKTQSKIKLVFAGKKGWLYQNVLDYIETNKLKDEVLFTGYISEEEKVILLKHAKAFFFLSRYEGFGIPPLEALRMKVPTLLSDIPVFHELYGENAYYAKVDNINEIALQMENILNNPKQIDISSLEKFSWEISAKKLVKILDKIQDIKLKD